MVFKKVCIAMIMVCVPAVTVAQESVKAPSCIRITESNADHATIQFEPHGGERFEAERYYNGRWKPYSTRIRTTGAENTVIVPLSKSLMNNIRICAEAGTTRVCSEEGVYAKR